MSLNYSFNGIPILNIQKLISSLVPGLDKILTVYHCIDINDLKATLISDPELNEVEEIIIPEKSFFEELMVKKHTFSWHQKDELPFHIPKSIDKQVDMFAFKDVVLIIRILSQKENLYDLLFLYFKENVNYFGFRKGNKALDLENKTIIGTILYNTINTILKKDGEDSYTYTEDKTVIQSIIKRVRDQRKEYHSTLEKYKRSIVDLSKKYLSEISGSRDIEFILTDRAIIELKSYSGDISKLKQIIETAAYEAEVLNYNTDVQQVKVDEYFLDLKSEDEYPVAILDIDTKSEDRYYKTRALLDKLEAAVIKLKDKNINITGTNVGKVCPIPITAPAITDALRKHRKKILQLIQDNPDNWSLLRKEFRPLQNILVTKTSISA